MVSELKPKQYVDWQLFGLLKKWKAEGTLGKKQLTQDLWLNAQQAKDLGYNQGESDFLLESTGAPFVGGGGKIPRPTIEPPPMVTTQPITGSSELEKTLRNLYPDIFGSPDANAGLSYRDIAMQGVGKVKQAASLGQVNLQDTLSAVKQVAYEDTGAFVTHLQTQGRTPDTEALLRTLVSGEVKVDGTAYTPAEVDQFIDEVLPKPKGKIIVQNGVRKLVPLSEWDNYKLPMITTPAGNKVAYRMTDQEWADMTSQEKDFYKANPQSWLANRSVFTGGRVAYGRLKIISEGIFGIKVDPQTPLDYLVNIVNAELWVVPLPLPKVLGVAGKLTAGLHILPEEARAFVKPAEDLIKKIATIEIGKTATKLPPKVAEEAKKIAQDAVEEMKKVETPEIKLAEVVKPRPPVAEVKPPEVAQVGVKEAVPEKIIPVKSVVPKVTKEVWQMTQGEYDNYVVSLRKLQERGLTEKLTTRMARASDEITRVEAGRTHKWQIEKALTEGKLVPAEVLKDYPDLAQKVTPAPGVMTEEQYLASKGAGFMGGAEPALHKNIPEGRGRQQNVARVQAEMAANNAKREALRQEYRTKVASGEIRPPTRTESLMSTAQGNPDNEATQAARRLLEKRGISWEQPSVIPKAKAGMPEAGLQQGMFGEQKAVFPKGKGKVTQVSMDEQLQLEQYQRAAEAKGLKATHELDPVAQFRFKMGNRNVGLDSLISIREGSFPDYLTVKQAQALNPDKSFARYLQKGTKDYNHVPKDVVLDDLTKQFNMTPDEIADRIFVLRAEKARIRELSRPIDIDEVVSTETEPYQEAVSQGVPPSEAPPPPAQTVTVPKSLPEPARDSEIKRIIAQSEEQLRQDKPRLVTILIHKIPGGKQLLEYVRPGLKMTDNPEVLTSMVAEQQAKAGVHAWATATQIKLVNDLRDVFGNDVLHGGVSKIKFLGTAEQAKNKITGTLLDMAQNPELYELTDQQLASLVNINIHNDQMLDWVVSNYGADIGHWTPKPNGAYLPNVDIGDDVIQYLQSETRAVAQGRGKTRVWATARDRMTGKTSFEPELDVQKLLEGLDNFKASAAGGNTYKAAIGGLTRLEAMETTHPELFAKVTALRKELNSLKGSAQTIESNFGTVIDEFMKSPVEDADLLVLKDNLDVELKTGIRKGLNMTAIQDKITAVQDQIDTIRPAWKVANLKPYVFVQEGLYRYFPADKAQLIIESRTVSNNRLTGFIEKWRAGAFSGDASPFSQQGVLGVLVDPGGSLKVAGGGIKSAIEHQDLLRSFRVTALADDIATDPELWSQYAELSGRGIISATPAEYATGWLSKIPKAGKVIDKFNESTFVTVTRGSFNLWKREFTQMVKAGVPELEAKVAAMRSASAVYPLFNVKLAGQSEARASLLRSLPTSISFIVQPAKLIAEGSRGLAKLAAFQKLTPAESSAAKLLVTMAASTLAVSATSAYASAKALGKSDEEAWQEALNAINPHPMNGKFASIIIGNTRIPLGGPYRSIFRAIYPAQVKGIPFPIPFAGVPNFFRNRISPAIRTQLDMAPAIIGKPEAAVDYNKVQIFNTKDGSVFENILRGLEYEFENILPLTLGTIAEAKREGEKYREPLLQQVIGQFVGVNPVTLDNTYIDRQTKQLGMPKEIEASPFTIQKKEVYNTKDLYGDVSSVLRKRNGEGFKDKPLTLAIKVAMGVKDASETYLNAKLSGLSDDQWELLQRRQDLTDTTEFDKTNPLLSKISQRDYLLLREYKSITDKKVQTQFLMEHLELSLNPRLDWLKTHPKENAQLVLFGQAKVLTKEAYNEVLRLVKELDIPDSAVPDFQIPKDSVDNYFKYQDMVSEDKNSTWEAQLMLSKDTKLRDFLGLKPTDTPIASLELKVRNRANFDKLDDFSDEKSPDYIADEKKRADAVAKFKADNPAFVDDTRRIDAIEKGTDKTPTPDTIIKTHVDYGKLIDQEGVGSSSAEVMLYRVDNPEYDKWRQDTNLWGDQSLKPIDQSKIPVWRIDVEYAKQDTAYDALSAIGTARQDYLTQNADYATARRQREAYGKGLTGQSVTNYTDYYALPETGYRRDRFLQQHPTFALVLGLKVKDKIPSEQWDVLTEQYKSQDTAYEALTDKGAQADYLATNPDYADSRLRRDAYKLYVPDNLVEDYVGYKTIPKGTYEDDWFLMEHSDFYKEVYLGILGNQKKDYRKVPTREVWTLYQQYQDLYGRAQEDFRLTHPDLEAWGEVTLGWKPIKPKTPLTTSQQQYENLMGRLKVLSK